MDVLKASELVEEDTRTQKPVFFDHPSNRFGGGARVRGWEHLSGAP